VTLGRESTGLESAPVSDDRRAAARPGLRRGGGGVAKVLGLGEGEMESRGGV
jgi:hypothetical protein